MAKNVSTGGFHHVVLTVSDLTASIEFYTDLLGFQKVMDISPTRVLLANGEVILALTQAEEPVAGDRFNENRIGLDHLSLTVGSRSDLEDASRLFDAQDISHGEIKDLGEALQIYVLAFRDPDNIQLELTAPYS